MSAHVRTSANAARISRRWPLLRLPGIVRRNRREDDRETISQSPAAQIPQFGQIGPQMFDQFHRLIQNRFDKLSRLIHRAMQRFNGLLFQFEKFWFRSVESFAESCWSSRLSNLATLAEVGGKKMPRAETTADSIGNCRLDCHRWSSGSHIYTCRYHKLEFTRFNRVMAICTKCCSLQSLNF